MEGSWKPRSRTGSPIFNSFGSQKFRHEQPPTLRLKLAEGIVKEKSKKSHPATRLKQGIEEPPLHGLPKTQKQSGDILFFGGFAAGGAAAAGATAAAAAGALAAIGPAASRSHGLLGPV